MGRSTAPIRTGARSGKSLQPVQIYRAHVAPQVSGEALGTTWTVKLASKGLPPELERKTAHEITARIEDADAALSRPLSREVGHPAVERPVAVVGEHDRLAVLAGGPQSIDDVVGCRTFVSTVPGNRHQLHHHFGGFKGIDARV